MEIEIKARLKDKKKVATKLKQLGAEEQKQKHQFDQYYNHPSKDIRETNEYIRLRYLHNKNKGKFCYHVNAGDATKEYEVPVEDINTFKQILKLCGFSPLGLIDKKRRTFDLDSFEITIDEVNGIGDFLEIEIDGEINEVKVKKARCLKLLEKIGLSKQDTCNIWLCDIATRKDN
ncbi:MAG: class IV adenylate cyclase [Nanoarchaeota archaeon]|nr:class IV adenylate cyclase [Nanoarchaeota archaeon]